MIYCVCDWFLFCIQLAFICLSLSLSLQFWREELADIAQTYADECTLHPMANSPRTEPVIHSIRNIGQNVRVMTECNEETNLTQIMEEWFLQRFNYDYSTISCDEDESCANYLQVRFLTRTLCTVTVIYIVMIASIFETPIPIGRMVSKL